VEEPTRENVNHVLETMIFAVIVTKEEDQLLNQMGFQKTMPTNWDEIDPYARYRAAGIELDEA
jgi:hypothetical protein